MIIRVLRALSARAVLIARAFLWGPAANGQAGEKNVSRVYTEHDNDLVLLQRRLPRDMRHRVSIPGFYGPTVAPVGWPRRSACVRR